MAIVSARGGRPWTFYVLAAIFVGYVAFLYGPMLCIYVLSFQGPQGGLTFPMRGAGLHWFNQLLSQGDTGDLIGAISRSLPLAVLVMAITVIVSFAAGMAFRARFPGSNWLFYLVVASLVAPGYVLGIGIGLMFQLLGWNTDWYTSALGAQLSWTLPFGLLIMFAVFGRYDRAYEEAARDLGAFPVQTLRLVVVPMLLPGVIAVALFGFTLSYDEFARTLQTVGSSNTVPIEIWSMTQNVTTPSIYALGTLTTALSFVVIGVSLGTIALIQRRRVGMKSL
ncbi:MAG: ABC transporter permease [Alphaproteobacteria bacterium]|nr:ABC transporter permease [Alphaproteobacteria bacterium]